MKNETPGSEKLHPILRPYNEEIKHYTASLLQISYQEFEELEKRVAHLEARH